MTIYLYKKTHNKTGLMYLGKTIQDPYLYKGSGTYWASHLRVHGNDVTTEVLRECSSNDEVKVWGKHYSDLWNIVESETWANLKPEEGEGGFFFKYGLNPALESSVVAKRSGKNHYMHDPEYDNSKHPWKQKAYAEAASLRWEGDKHPSKNPELLAKRSGENHHSRKPEFVPLLAEKNGMHDDKVYTWHHVATGNEVKMTRHSFIRTYDLMKHQGNISSMINGKTKIVKGWVIVE